MVTFWDWCETDRDIPWAEAHVLYISLTNTSFHFVLFKTSDLFVSAKIKRKITAILTKQSKKHETLRDFWESDLTDSTPDSALTYKSSIFTGFNYPPTVILISGAWISVASTVNSFKSVQFYPLDLFKSLEIHYLTRL